MYFTVTYFNADFKVIFICANDVVRRRGYGDHFITMCVYVGTYVSTIKRKSLSINDLKHGTVVAVTDL